MGDDFGAEMSLHGLSLDGARSWSLVNLVLPLNVADGGIPTAVFGLAHWVLPRVPAVGEEILALDVRITVERVTWDNEGRAVVRLEQLNLAPSKIDTLEREGWRISCWETAVPQEWVSD